MHCNYDAQNLEPACIYLRKSREDQEAEARGEGETLTKHKKALLRLAKELNIKISRIYEEIASGESIIHRPEMLQLLKDVEAKHWNSVFCMDLDRLGRGNMQDQGLILETFKQAKTKIVTSRKIYDLLDEFDEEYSEFEAFMARKELKIITRRLQGGRVRSVRDGKNYIGARPPYGYLVEKKNNERILIPHPEQSSVVKMIFAWYTHPDPEKRRGTGKIATELNRLGFRSYTGIAWKASSVLTIIKNAVYAGRLQWKKKEYTKAKDPGKRRTTKTRPRREWIDVRGKHEPLISMDTYLKAQEILHSKYHTPYNLQKNIVNPLAGLIKCQMCGASMILRPYSKQKSHLICYNSQCPNKSTRFEYVEARIIEALKAWLSEYKDKWEHYGKSDIYNNEATINRKICENLHKELQELQQQQERLHDFLERGIYDERTYLKRMKSLSERIESARIGIISSEATLKLAEKRQQTHRVIIPRVESVIAQYDNTADPVLKNALLKSVLNQATYRKEKYQRNDEFTLTLYPKLPHQNYK